MPEKVIKMLKNKTIVLSLWFFIFVCSIYCLISSGHYGGDAVNNYLTTESIVLRGSLAMPDGSFPVKEIKADNTGGSIGKDGKRYSQYGIGMPILQIPLFMLGLLASKILPSLSQSYITFFSVSFTNAMISAVNSVLLLNIMFLLGLDKKRALALSIIYSFTTMAVVYAKTGFSEPAIITFLLLSIYCIFAAENKNARSKNIIMLLAGASLGFAGVVKSCIVILLPLFIIYLLLKRKGARELFIFFSGFLITFSLELAANYIRFGGILETGYGNAVSFGTRNGHNFFKGLYYYWISSGKGFFFYNLPLLAAIFAWRTIYIRKKKESLFLLSIIAVYSVYFAYFFQRGSIFSWGPRYLLPITPIFILFMEDMFKKKALIYLLSALTIAGFLVQLPAIIINYSQYIYFAKEKLLIEEYMVNFIPELSPINGCWHLLLKIPFTFSPDPVFIRGVSSSVSQYAVTDLWYVNMMNYSRSLIYIAIIGAVLFVSLAVFSGTLLLKKTKYIK